jgi:protein-tyrosine phosphatase
VHAWRQAGLDVIVSLLTEDEVEDLNLAQEAHYCQARDLEFLNFPIHDLSVPASRAAAFQLLERLHKMLDSGQSIAVHCRQGIGRSGLVTACLLTMSGLAPTVAFQRISAARGLGVPETPEQRVWVVQFAQELTISATRL